jgi:hypothetical protein
MEDRVIIAVALLFLMTAVTGWFIYRKIDERRKFKLRQSGRGKGNDTHFFEPAE